MRTRFRHLVEAIVAAILLLYQRIPFSGGAFTMLLPIAGLILDLPIYIPALMRNPELLTYEVYYWRLSTMEGVLGLLTAIVGSAIFLAAGIHFLKSRGKLVTAGLYSIVRHPQYLGIMLIVLGTSVLCMGSAFDLLLALVGYTLLAGYEERNLLKERGTEYLEYRKRTSFIFPVWCPPIVSEYLYSTILVVLMFIVALLSGSLTTNGTEWYPK